AITAAGGSAEALVFDITDTAAIEAAFVIAERFLGKTQPIAPRHLDAIQRGLRQQVMSIIDARPPQARITADALAKSVGVSRLAEGFAYVQHRRLSRAFAALRSRNTPIIDFTALAASSGFADRRAFAQAFRSRFGMDPRDVSPSEHFSGAAWGEGPADRALHDVITDWMKSGEIV
ncbi:hypothetical protein LTR94_029784, partial [Friedmanniomyces endolithicus]